MYQASIFIYILKKIMEGNTMGKKNKVFLGILAALVVVLYLLAGDYLESRVESYADQSYNYSTARYFYIAYWLIGALLLRVWCFIARERKKQDGHLMCQRLRPLLYWPYSARRRSFPTARI